MSNRLTFSLASLIVLIALGLVFVPTSVMADNGGLVGTAHNMNGHADQTAANNAELHQADHVHPKPTLSLKPGSNVLGSEVVIAAESDDTTAVRDDEFTIVVDFDMDVSENASDTAVSTGNTAGLDLIGDFSQSTQNADGATISAGLTLSDLSGLTPAGPAAINRVAGDNSKFEVRFRVPIGGIPTGTAALRTVTYRISLNAGIGVYGLAQFDNGVNPTNGQDNLASDALVIKLVQSLTNQKPTLTISTDAPSTAVDSRSFDVTYTTADGNGDNVTVTGSIAVDPLSAASHYSIPSNISSPVTITQSMASTSKRSIPEATVTLTLTPNDGTVDGDADTIAVPFAAQTWTPPTPVAFTVDGTPSLTASFAVTFTAATATMLAYSDIDVMGGYAVEDSLNPKVSAKVFTVIVQPYPGTEMVSVTIKDDDTTAAAAAATMGKIEARKLVSVLQSIMGPATHDGKVFVATLTFAKALPSGTSVMMSHLKITNGAAGTPGVMPGSEGKKWQVEVTPTAANTAVMIELSDAGKLKYGSSASALTVKKKAAAPTTPPALGTLTATYNDETGVVTIASGQAIAKNGFAVIMFPHVPDIQRFFAEGGTISVLGTSGTSKDIVISEIMWGLNLRAVGSERAENQFIELYNTTGAAINLSGVTLLFDSSDTPTAAPSGETLLDQISSVVPRSEWLITDAPGQSGRIAIANDVTTFVALDLVSMYRNIPYDRVEKMDWDADAAKNRAAQLREKNLAGNADQKWKNGSAIGNWKASNAADTYAVNKIGSPGMEHFVAYEKLTATSIARGTFIINEIGNHSNDAYDWVELKRVGGGDNLKKWRLSQVTTGKKDTSVVHFPDNDNHKIPAVGDVLLIVNSDPYQDPNHPLAAGTRINGGRPETTGITSRYYVDSGLKLANSGKSLLILRHDNGATGSASNIQDVVGTLKTTDNAPTLRTDLWPLVATGAPNGNVIDGTDDEDFRAGKVYRRAKEGGGTGEKHIATAGYTGIGYKRSAAKSNQNGGTPGYDNGAVKVNDSELAGNATVAISEIMYAKDRNLPQWIELYNSSTTQAVNISEWKLKIEHSRDADDVDIRIPAMTTNNLGGGIIIPPNQTVLIVSNTTGRTSRAVQGAIDFPASRIINLWGQKDKLEVNTANKTRLSYSFLSQTAFKITLMDKSGAMVDTVGNLDTDHMSATYGQAMWDLPTNGDEGRSSIIRRYDNTGTVPRNVADGTARAGTMEDAWVLAADSALAAVRWHETYYGSPDDVGTPGYRAGGALPVSLSKFRPERLESGEIVIRWVTESELNNAGFNILRSDTRNGEFTKLNTNLIAGQGTTSERTTYAYPDTSAKSNVVYYYQIQDVSLDGQVQTLHQSRLKGHISVAGKLTTTWGELKALR